MILSPHVFSPPFLPFCPPLLLCPTSPSCPPLISLSFQPPSSSLHLSFPQVLQMGSEILPSTSRRLPRPLLTSSCTTAPSRPRGTGSSSSSPSTRPSWCPTTCPSRPSRTTWPGGGGQHRGCDLPGGHRAELPHHVCGPGRGGDLRPQADPDELCEDLVCHRPVVLFTLRCHQCLRECRRGGCGFFFFTSSILKDHRNRLFLWNATHLILCWMCAGHLL